MNLISSSVRITSRSSRGFFRGVYQRYAHEINLGTLLALFALIAGWQSVAATVPAGHVAVKWYRFSGGTDTATVYAEGTRLIWPWDRIELYDARVQQVNHDFEVLSKDGLMFTVNIAVTFKVNVAALGKLHKYVGGSYVETLLVPMIGSHALSVFSQNSTDDIYTARRFAIEAEIRQAIIAGLERDMGEVGGGGGSLPWLLLEDVLIRDMRFPPEVQAAINRKMAEYQLRQEYNYRLQREELESQRKEVEARGIAQFQRIVGAGISENYLRWRSIDATLALSRSPNTKIVVIGSARDGMPLILGGTDVQLPLASVRGAAVSSTAGSDAAGKADASTSNPPLLDSVQTNVVRSVPADATTRSGDDTVREQATPGQ